MKPFLKFLPVVLTLTLGLGNVFGQNSFPASGNVGVGTSSPQVPLHVISPASGQLAILAQGGDANFRLVSRQDLSVNSDGSILTELNLEYGTARNAGIRFHRGWSATGGFLSFSTDSGLERMRIATNGNIGIGTTNPSQRLDVNGTIKSREVMVTVTGWPDYVFEPEYNLLPLADLKSFVATNGHLPGIPKADEVESNGIGLAEMNVKLLEKIEELTLYILHQEERIKILESSLDTKQKH